VGKLEGYGENQRELGSVASKRGSGVGLALPYCAGAPDRILPRRDRHRSTGSFIELALVPARFRDHWCGLFFLLQAPIPHLPRVGRRFRGAGGDALRPLLWRWKSGTSLDFHFVPHSSVDRAWEESFVTSWCRKSGFCLPTENFSLHRMLLKVAQSLHEMVRSIRQFSASHILFALVGEVLCRARARQGWRELACVSENTAG
jgi:hypothetical protein